jgi:putative ABC transport system ATP-binding protein
VADPEVVFADEPTGVLDSTTGREVLRLLRAVVDRTARTVVMVTHDPVAASYADHVPDSRVAGHLDNPTADTVAARLAHMEA